MTHSDTVLLASSMFGDEPFSAEDMARAAPGIARISPVLKHMVDSKLLSKDQGLYKITALGSSMREKYRPIPNLVALSKRSKKKIFGAFRKTVHPSFISKMVELALPELQKIDAMPFAEAWETIEKLRQETNSGRDAPAAYGLDKWEHVVFCVYESLLTYDETGYLTAWSLMELDDEIECTIEGSKLSLNYFEACGIVAYTLIRGPLRLECCGEPFSDELLYFYDDPVVWFYGSRPTGIDERDYQAKIVGLDRVFEFVEEWGLEWFATGVATMCEADGVDVNDLLKMTVYGKEQRWVSE